MKRFPLLLIVLLVAFIAGSKGLDFLDLGSQKSIKSGKERGLRGGSTEATEKTATSDVAFLDIAKDVKVAATEPSKAEAKKEAGVLEEFTPSTKKEKSSKKKSAEGETKEAGVLEEFSPTGKKDKESSKKKSSDAQSNKKLSSKPKAENSAEGAVELIDLTSSSSASTGEKPVSTGRTDSSSSKAAAPDAGQLDLSASSAAKGDQPKTTAADAGKASTDKDTEKKVEFVDINANSDASTKKETAPTTSKEANTAAKVDFIDLNANSVSGTAASSTSKGTDKSTSTTTPSSDAKAATSSADQQKVEFIDVSGDASSTKASNKEESSSKSKKSSSKSSKSSSKSNDKDKDKVEFIDVSDSKKPSATADKKKEKDTAAAAAAPTDQVQLMDAEPTKKEKKASSASASDTIELSSASDTSTKAATPADDSSASKEVVLITGITSGIGTEIAKQLLASSTSSSTKIYGLVRNENTSLNHLKSKAISFLVGDITDSMRVLDVIKEVKPTVIYHLAGRETDYASSSSNAQSTVTLHVQGTLNLLEALKRNELFSTKFFYGGSSSEYGFSSDSFKCEPIPESTPLNPRSVFGLSKSTAESLVLQYNKHFDIPVYIGRFFSVTGPGESNGISFYAKELIQLELELKEGPLELYNPAVLNDMIDTRDAAAAVMAIMQKGKVGEAYNIGSGKTISTQTAVIEMAKLSKKTSGLKAKTIIESKKEKDCDKCAIADISRLSLTGYAPKYSVAETLTRIMEFWREQLGKDATAASSASKP